MKGNKFIVDKVSTASSLFVAYLLLFFIKNIIQYIELTFTGSSSFASLLSYLLFALAIFDICFLNTYSDISRIVFTTALVGAAFLLNWLMFPNNDRFMSESIKDVILIYIPQMLMAVNIQDYNALGKEIEKREPIFLIMSWVLILLYSMDVIRLSFTSYMMIAYDLIVPITIVGYYAILHDAKLHYISFWASSIALIIMGCRGAFICAIVCHILLYFFTKREAKKNIKFVLLLAFAVFLFFIFYDRFMGILQQYGNNTRLYDLISRDAFWEDSGRSSITNAVFNYMNNHNQIMYGMWGDRYLASVSGRTGIYMHNIVYEFWVDFGYVLGTILFAVLIIVTIRKLYKTSGTQREIILMFAALALTKLMFSSSYLIEHLFYIYVGLLISKDICVPAVGEETVDA